MGGYIFFFEYGQLYILLDNQWQETYIKPWSGEKKKWSSYRIVSASPMPELDAEFQESHSLTITNIILILLWSCDNDCGVLDCW